MQARRSTPMVVSLLLVALAGLAKRVEAQAWTPARGEGYVSVAFSDQFVKDHLQSNGDRADLGHIRSLILAQSVEYGVTDRLSVDLTLPIVAAKYIGPVPHQPLIDNGNYHGGTQDFTFGVRYSVRKRPFALTPFLSATVPSRDYTYFAHSAVGMNLRMLSFGVAAGKELEPWLSNAYVEGAYSYSVVQRVTGVRPNRNNMSVGAGYFLGRHLAVRALAEALVTHGGFNLPGDFPELKNSPPTQDEHFFHHDQSANAKHLNIGGEASVSVGRNWDVFAGLTHTLWGENEHATRLGVSMGVSRRFTTPWARHRRFHDTSTSPSTIDRN